MKQVNNYLKKGALILMAFMLFVIPNLHVYSSIGSYQIASSAIIANKNNTPLNNINHSVNNKRIVNIFGVEVTMDGVTYTDYESYNGIITYIVGILNDEKMQESQGCSAFKYFTKPYAKYDFSGFDN